MSLTENQLKALKPKDKPYKLPDERGLYVEVSPTGGKLWRFRYRVGKIEKKLSIGTYPDLSLKEARHAALEARMVVSKGGYPALDKRKQKIRAEFMLDSALETLAAIHDQRDPVSQTGDGDKEVLLANELALAAVDHPYSAVAGQTLGHVRIECIGKVETPQHRIARSKQHFDTRAGSDEHALLAYVENLGPVGIEQAAVMIARGPANWVTSMQFEPLLLIELDRAAVVAGTQLDGPEAVLAPAHEADVPLGGCASESPSGPVKGGPAHLRGTRLGRLARAGRVPMRDRPTRAWPSRVARVLRLAQGLSRE